MVASLLPDAWFAAQGTWFLWLALAGSFALLAFGADRAVSAAARLARAMGISKVIVGATIVSLGTTTPEACVSVTAAFRGDGGLALGNAVGSIIVDTGLIFGLCCALKIIPKDRFVLSRHGWLQTGAGLLLTGLCLGLWAASGNLDDVWIPRWAGVLLLALLVGYLYVSVRWGRRHPGIVPNEAAAGSAAHAPGTVVWLLLAVVGGLALVVAGSDAAIASAKVICERAHVPPAVLAVTLVAFGTSLPELVTAITALIKGHEELSVGNIIGADILNVLFVTGAAASATPVKVEPAFFYLYLPTMMVVLLLFRLYIFAPGNTFRRWQGVLLMAVYAVSVVLTLRLGVAAP
jgi:cation:H+ antiporter